MRGIRALTRPNPSRPYPLYDPRFESDSCGTGFVARTSGKPSREIVDLALQAVAHLEHRGAIAADGISGDGAGVLTEIPRRLFAREASRLGYRLAPDEPLAVGLLFLPPTDPTAPQLLEQALASHGIKVLGWRDVPIDRAQLGDFARATCPEMRHVLAVPAARLSGDAFERELYLARKAFERDLPAAYVSSLSAQRLGYKALCAPHQLPAVFPDLADPEYETAFALYHQRFSTNTLPAWEIAQPFRLLAHNGEINTLWGNRAWIHCREHELPEALVPVLPEAGSDSADLDAVLELLTRNGRDILHALAMLIVPAWENPSLGLRPEVVAFYRYHASLMEPWDGPAALVFADGRYVGAALDRNGLRPCRYVVTREGLVIAGSEVGLVDLDPEHVTERGRLGPGQMIAVDLAERRVIRDDEIKRRVASRPFADWVQPWPLPETGSAPQGIESLVANPVQLARCQRLYGFTHESVSIVLTPMAHEGTPVTWSMGDDTPIPPLGREPRSLYAFFRQRFAQVTNPAIDPLREACVMSLTTWLGPRPHLLADGPQPLVLELRSPVLSLAQLEHIRHQTDLPVATVACVFPNEPDLLEPAIDAVSARALAAVRDGASILILSDTDVSPGAAPMPMALAVGPVHHDLVRAGLRTKVGLVVEAGDCYDEHHVAVLLGYGAGAVCPWMALAGSRALHGAEGEARTIEALSSGIRKVMSKMGISTISSYRGSQLFDALGLAQDVVARCFTGTASPIGGLGFVEIAKQVLDRHKTWSSPTASQVLPDRGLVRFRRAGEHHAWSPATVRVLQRAVGSEKRPKSDAPAVADWEVFRTTVKTDLSADVRSLLRLIPAGPPLVGGEVEPREHIVRRFATSAMSLGALSPEAHRTLTVAMNRLGAKSNTGEGGEDPSQYDRQADGDRADNKVKQVASGRFGVTAEYLAHAEEIEIKIAQGSKPGEGGQLPGHKVTALIARLRHSQPGLPLISPPPHHDIYSIEDLAQLIYDLKRCNPRSKVAVKLVAEAGIGTIAAGVTKAYADYVVISGHSGGTGASPLSGIKHAGWSWELGLAEVQQVLMRSKLRERVRIRVDGGLQSATDVLIAAALGADEFGFGTAPLVAMGCDMARQCHLNTCPTGIATQRRDLRAKFRGKPEHVVRYFLSLAQDIRETLGLLGLRTLDDLIGRVELLRPAQAPSGLDLAALLAPPGNGARHGSGQRNDRPEPEPVDEAIAVAALRAAETGQDFVTDLTITNRDRSVGAVVAGALAARWGLERPGGNVEIRCTGSAGQSFGAFATPGMRLSLVGEANDYVGKGLSGGVIVLRPTGPGRTAPHEHTIVGNVVLYGATGGGLFAAGRAGERFAIRNSGAVAVVEGVGDHGCEYMTGGTVVVLGKTGGNFGAGMTGGVAYVYDHEGGFPERVNPGHVAWLRCPPEDYETLAALVRQHLAETDSSRARELLAAWHGTRGSFWKVAPKASPQTHLETIAFTHRASEKPAFA